MVDNPAGPIRNIQMKHTQKTEGKRGEKRGQDRKDSRGHNEGGGKGKGGEEREGRERKRQDAVKRECKLNGWIKREERRVPCF